MSGSNAPRKADGRHVRGHRRQRAVIDAARALFIERGYRRTTLDAIIAVAGGSRETIYRAFGGKRGLFGTIIAEVGQRLADAVIAPDALDLPPHEGLTRFASDLVTIWSSEEGAAMNRVVLSEGLDAPELVDAWYLGGTKLSIEALSRYLDAQCAAGNLLPLNAALVARQFIMLLMGEMAFPLIARDQEVGPAAVIERCVGLVLRAYLVRLTGEQETPPQQHI